MLDTRHTPPSRDALIVAHGSPADPAPQEATLMALAVRTAFWLPGWRVRGATLAAPGALEAALTRLHDPLIYPFFIAEGWFTRTTLPRRLADADHPGLTQLPAFGHDPALPALMAELALAAAEDHALTASRTTLVLAAHGSKVSRASATITEEVAAKLRSYGIFASVRCGYIEEAPYLSDALAPGDHGPALCLPFFALNAGHVQDDVPEAWARAGNPGPLLPPVGEALFVPRLIAATLSAHANVR